MIVNQRGPITLNLVGTNRRPHAATANRHSSLHISSRYGVRKRDDVAGTVIARVPFRSAEFDDFMSCGAELGNELFLQSKPAVIGSDPYEHAVLPFMAGSQPGSCRCSWSSSESFSGCGHRDPALIVIRT
jgi:hypothetical protein